jgi:hypothetical protein
MSFTFNNLNLKNIEVSNGGSILPVGNHVVEVTNVKGETKKGTGAQQIVVSMQEVDGVRTITDWIIVHNPNHPKNAEIGLSQLKSLCHWGGHPDPDNPFPDGDLSVLKGLMVGIWVKEDTYNGKTSNKVASYKDPKRINPEFNPEAIKNPLGAAVANQMNGAAKSGLDDDVPF